MKSVYPDGIDVVVVTFNSAEFLPRLAASIRSCESISTITIVDNKSTDNSADVASSLNWGCDTRVLRRGVNPGFGSSMNLGVLGHPNPHRSVLLLNPDVVISPDCLATLDDVLVDHEQIACVGPVLRTSEGNAVSSARKFPTRRSILRRSYEDEAHNGEVVQVDWLCGASMLWRRDAFERIGGFSEKYFLYFEDVDICRRAWDAGFKIALDGASEAVHDQGHGERTSAYLRRQSRISRRVYAQSWLGNSGLASAKIADGVDLAATAYHFFKRKQ